MIKTCLLILGLLQSQPRIPKLVWAGAIVIFLAGVSMLVYFLTRLKKGEKEQEEDDWRTSRRSLFVEPAEPAPPEPKIDMKRSSPVSSKERSDRATPADVPESSDAPVTTSIGASEAGSPPPKIEPPPTVVHEPPQPQLSTLITGPDAGSPPPRLEPPPPVVHEPPQSQLELNRAAQEKERATQLLGSRPAGPAEEGTVLGDDVFAALERKEPAEPSKPAPQARVEQRPRRGTFEPPAIQPIAPRPPFEAPRIDRLVPRGTASASETPRAEPAVRQPQPEPRLPETHIGTPVAASTPSAGGAMPAGTRHKPAGSVLGLPVESSRGPLILGESAQKRGDVGIGALSNYGKETGPEGGRGGTIALALTILIVGGGALSYLYLPSVHAKVDSVVSRLRGDPPPEPPVPPAARPRAQIVAGSSEAVKNLVKAKGAVYNISTETLENLSVEISLERGPDAAPDTRTIPVTPSRLEPRQQGRYEFEYDGSKGKGYPSGYRVTKLLSNDGEVKFTVPGQPRSQ